MANFNQAKNDVLVCTTIIESGLDLPNVNTLIVDKANRFGLTQLYQLRGRIGRGANTAYAYFLFDKGKQLSHVAEMRLRTIFEATELGAGFGIALKDLEIRGAGTLLGVKQSGHISAVGFTLYCRLLAEAVEKQKANQIGTEIDKEAHLPLPSIDLPLPAYIPEDYVTDLRIRLNLYQNMVMIDKAEQLETLVQEFNDRFGALPTEVKNLIYTVKVKVLATNAGIESISTERGTIILRLFECVKFDKKKLEIISREGLMIGNNQIRLNLRCLEKKWQQVLEEVLERIK
jgi:transcription-repair coupling factor (superfamily II helicase)